MESRKRKEAPGPAAEDVAATLDRRTKSRELNEEQEENTGKTQVPIISEAGPETSIEPSPATDGNEDNTVATATATAAAIDTAALAIDNTESATVAVTNEPATEDSNQIAIEIETAPIAPTDIVENSDLNTTSGLALAPKVPPKPTKPSTPEELVHWNQMFFELMVRVSTVLFCSSLSWFRLP